MSKQRRVNGVAALSVRCIVAALSAALFLGGAQSQEPIRVGVSLPVTGPLSPLSQDLLVALRIWVVEANKRPLLGRNVALVIHDNNGDVKHLRENYALMIQRQRVDLLIITRLFGSSLAWVEPMLAESGKIGFGIFGGGPRAFGQIPQFFAMIEGGAPTKESYTQEFFKTAASQATKRRTLALLAADVPFTRLVAEGARINAKGKFEIIHDKAYRVGATNFVEEVELLKKLDPDVVFLCSYPLDSVALVKAIHAAGLETRMIGGVMMGLQTPPIRKELHSRMNGFTVAQTSLLPPSAMFEGTDTFLEEYQKRAGFPAGRFGPDVLRNDGMLAYSALQIFGQAVEATQSLDGAVLARHVGSNTFKTILGDMRFDAGRSVGPTRFILVQWVRGGSEPAPGSRETSAMTILAPSGYKTGSLVYPYGKAK